MPSFKIPLTPSELTSMSGKDWLNFIAFTGAVAGAVHLTQVYICDKKNKAARCNTSISLEKAKIVDSATISEISGSGGKWYCRCWKSKKWPYCDGSHTKHNQETGDNVGPLGIKDE